MRWTLLAIALPLLGQPDLVKHVEFEGTPSLLLSNDKLELTMFTTGGAFANLVMRDDASQMSPLWNPARLAREAGTKPRFGTSFGHFVCVDGFGPVSPEEQAAGLPGHGEAHEQPWALESAVKNDGVFAAVFSVKLPLLQESFRRTVRMVDGESVVYVESELESHLAFDHPVEWAEHATIGAPFLDPGKTVVDMSAHRAKTRTYVDENGPRPHRLANSKEFTWPMAPGRNGQLINLRAAPVHPNSMDHTTSLMDVNRKLAFVTALNPEKHLIFGYVFKREEYPWVQGWEEYPPDGGVVRGMEISTLPFDVPRREAITLGSLFGIPTFRWLPAKSKIGSHFLFFYTKAPDGMKKIDDVVLEDGKLTIIDRQAGKKIELKASLGL